LRREKESLMAISKITQRPYGNTGLMVSSLGLGAAQVGDQRLAEADASALLHTALDAGITLFDTAPSYGLSEQRIGQHLTTRRQEFVLSTKLGYGVQGLQDWTGECITAGVEQALRIMRTDYIDIAHFHSCPKETLARGDIIEALERAKRDGKLRAIAYSGENDDLAYAIGMNVFDGFMASLNICDQRILREALPLMQNKGFIAKRPTANHPWRFDTQPNGDYCEEYWRRWRKMNPPNHGHEWGEVALRFALSVEGVASAIVGTGSLRHLQQNIQWAEKGPLAPEWVKELTDCFSLHDENWRGQI
jgi:aryl-alcohol dehydrogenase-like predicted oxidoreductase